MSLEKYAELKARPQITPLPTKTHRSGQDHFAKYDDVKGTATTEKFMPSFAPPKVASSELKKIDKEQPQGE
jgi:hypothetical protein